MTTSPDSVLLAYGMNPVQAVELASQMDGTPSAAKLIALGFSVPLANELATQMTAGTGNVGNLMALGVPAALADSIATTITSIGA